MVEKGSDIDTDIDNDNVNSAESMKQGEEEITDAPKTEEIKEQIEETRSKMGETIDAIQDRLSFTNISEQVSEHVNLVVDTAKDALYEATIGKARVIMKNIGSELSKNGIAKTVKDNPLPFILMGVGAGLLAYQSYGGKKNIGSRRLRLSGGNDGDRREDDPTSSVLSAARGKVGDAAGKVTNVAGSAYDKLSGTVGNAYSGAGDAVSQAYQKVGDLGSAAREQYSTYIEENPLAVGAVALALGAAVGMAIPATRYEGDLMGNARQDLMDRAQTTATDLIDKAKETITEAGRSIAEQATTAGDQATGTA